MNGAPSNKRPNLPPDSPVMDGVLAGLLLLCRATGTPTLALLAHGYKGSGADAEALDTSRALATAASGILDCAFSGVAIRSWEQPSARMAVDASGDMLYV